MRNPMKKLAWNDNGQDVIEYALLAAGISIAVIVTVPDIGAGLVGAYNAVLSAVTDILV